MNASNQSAQIRAAALAIVFVAIAFGSAGCASSQGPQVLTVPSGQYAAAFDAAADVAREAGLAPALRDRRGGVIETDPRAAGSLLEPWRVDNSSFEQAAANTITYQRRRARFEFAPAGFQAATENREPSAASGPDLVGADAAQSDLTLAQGELELRVWVYIERANIPGIRRGMWTHESTTITQLVAPEGVSGQAPAMSWTPVARDEAYERRLLAAVSAALGN